MTLDRPRLVAAIPAGGRARPRTRTAQSTQSPIRTAGSRAGTSASGSSSGMDGGLGLCSPGRVETSTTAVSRRFRPGRPAAGPVQPRLIAAAGPRRWTSSRKPLAAEFTLQRPQAVRDRQPLQLEGRRPGALRPVAAAGPLVRGAADPAGDARRPASSAISSPPDPTANIAVIGDLNDFQFSPPVQKLKYAGLVAMIERCPAERALQ